ncbi:flagellar biosynthetic protein FliQ [Myxococcota bacterium]|nr:flagellar biosynthetic protein FliQ [Myxococcota bacterium]MBU1380964.1 flagellar biosynthetic protein FliQ [Myxococcota bacterium]MBU1495772.1 flagellar biosynthetic protein FliQ [Myxococcota bacterium]
MSSALYLHLMQKALILTLLFSAIPLGISLITGLIISIIQSVTQIQEQTLSFVPKFLAVALSLLIFGPFIASELMSFSRLILRIIAGIG